MTARVMVRIDGKLVFAQDCQPHENSIGVGPAHSDRNAVLDALRHAHESMVIDMGGRK